jgi:GNAT superfamily N-acetyltransferase
MIIIPITTEREKLRFIKSEWNFYRNNSYWTAPLIMDRKKLLNQKKNPFYSHAEMQLWMAEENGEIVGRIAAIVNRTHNEVYHDTVGFWGFFDCVDRQEVANQLFDTAKGWLKTRGMTEMRGPVNPSINDSCGMLLNAYDDAPRVLMTYNPPYYPALCDGYGHQKAKDLHAWKISQETVYTPKLERVAKMVEERSRVKLRTINMKDLKGELAKIKEIYNAAWAGNWGALPMTEEEFDHMAGDLKAIVNPSIVFFAEIDDKPVAFALTLPDVNQALQSNRGGHILPAIPKLLFGLKKATWARIVILGVLPQYQQRGIDALLYYNIALSTRKIGVKWGEASWILEDNTMMVRAAELMNAELYKRYRIYEKAI